MNKHLMAGLSGLFFSTIVYGQGIQFQHGTWAEAKALAAKENKFIFVDAYAEWCGPCKWLSAEVFPTEKVGAFFNANFVSFKIDAEKGEGPDFAKQYGISAYPTLFYFDSKGELVHKSVGAMEGDKLVEIGKNAMDPNKQLFTLKKRYEGGERGLEFLYNCAKSMIDGGESESGATVAQEYLKLQPKEKWATKENFDLLMNVPTTTDSEMFQYILKNKKTFADALGEDKGNLTAYIDYVFLMPISQALYTGDKDAIAAAKADISKNAGEEAKRLLCKADYFMNMQNGINSKTFNSIAAYLDNYCDEPGELNQMAWAVYESSSSKKHLEKALNWVNESVELAKGYANMDTKAAVLYKLKRYADAQKAAEEAIALGKEEGSDVAATEELLTKIKSKK